MTYTPAAPAASPAWPQRRLVNVSVRQRFLWVDSEAYPLHNIARASSFVVKTNVWRAFRRFLKRCGIALLIWFGTAVVFALMSGPFGASDAAVFFATTAMVVAVCALLTSLVLLIAELAQPRRYALAVETTGAPYAFIVTLDPHQIDALVSHITHAINNPDIEFRYFIEHVHFGDKITQIGDRSSVNKR